jgi:hypothetical protein
MAAISFRRTLGALCGLTLLVGASAAEAQQRLTLRGFYSNVVSLSGATSLTSVDGSDAFALDVTEKKQWYAIELDARLNPTVSLNIAATSGRLQEELSLSSPPAPVVVARQISTLRHSTLSLLFHPLPGHLLDFYFGPSYGQARFERAFASSEVESAIGGKAGLDLQLGYSHWELGAELSILSSGFRIADGEPRRTVRYTVLGAGLGYRF